MFLSASLLLDYRAQRPAVSRSSGDRFWGGLSRAGCDDERVLRSDRAGGDEVDADGRDPTRCERV
jgi:hypothetical protein